MYPWKEGAVNLEIAKPGAVLGQKRGGAVVSQLVPKLKKSVPPPRGCTPPPFILDIGSEK